MWRGVLEDDKLPSRERGWVENQTEASKSFHFIMVGASLRVCMLLRDGCSLCFVKITPLFSNF
ncbi:hypothetical protein Hanom_Chr15g01402431 [Helianthus anomalus]